MMPGAELHRHLGEILVVLRLVRGQRIVPDLAVQTVIRVDVPERVHAQLLQAGGQATAICRPDVEPSGVSDRAFRVLDNQRLISRQTREVFRCIARKPSTIATAAQSQAV